MVQSASVDSEDDEPSLFSCFTRYGRLVGLDTLSDSDACSPDTGGSLDVTGRLEVYLV